MKSKLAIADIAIMKFVWQLTEAEIHKLDKFFLIACKVKDLNLNLNTPVNYPFGSEWSVIHQKRRFNVHFCDSMPNILLAKDLVLSFRENKASNFHWVLIDIKRDKS